VSTLVRPQKKIAVVGSGTMGNGIAQVAASNGLEVLLFDISQTQLDKALQIIQKSLSKLAEKGNVSESPDAVMKRLCPVTDLKKLDSAELVIEAATENRDIKFKLFSDLDQILSPGVVIATNTSSISVTEVASHTQRPELVAGMHFMNPVPVMSLVEGIRGLATSE